MDKSFTIKINSRLVPIARQMHQVSRIGDRRTGPGQSLEAYLSDLVAVAIVERTSTNLVTAEKETLASTGTISV